MIDDVLKDAARRMDKSVEATRHEFTTIRTGRASAALLERINVSAYGTKMPINQLATISVPEPRLLTITPFDKGVMRDIEKAIMESDLGLTPNNDGQLIPAITHIEAIERGLRVMDTTALSLCMDNRLPIYVFNLDDAGNIARLARGERLGTIVAAATSDLEAQVT